MIMISVDAKKLIEMYSDLSTTLVNDMIKESNKIKAAGHETVFNDAMVLESERKYLKKISLIENKIRMCKMVESILISEDEFIKLFPLGDNG